MEPTAIGSKARWAPQAKGMGCSWAAASDVQRAGTYCGATRTACFVCMLHGNTSYLRVLFFLAISYVSSVWLSLRYGLVPEIKALIDFLLID